MSEETYDIGKEIDDALAMYPNTSDASTGVSSESSVSDTTSDDVGATTDNWSTPHDNGGGIDDPKTKDTRIGGRDDNSDINKSDTSNKGNSNSNNGKPNGGKPNNGKRRLTEKERLERQLFNHRQAELRIARKRAKEQEEFYNKRNRLAEEYKQYAEENGKYSNANMALMKQDQIRELEIAEANRIRQNFIDDSYNTFQDERITAEFLKDCDTYGKWINDNEPQLREYASKPYGKLVLKGWLDKIAKNPNAADWWEDLTPFEKYKQLDRYYNQFSKYITAIQNGEDPTITNMGNSQEDKKVANAPVPNSGRDTNNMPPTNNFSMELDQAMRSYGINRLVR